MTASQQWWCVCCEFVVPLNGAGCVPPPRSGLVHQPLVPPSWLKLAAVDCSLEAVWSTDQFCIHKVMSEARQAESRLVRLRTPGLKRSASASRALGVTIGARRAWRMVEQHRHHQSATCYKSSQTLARMDPDHCDGLWSTTSRDCPSVCVETRHAAAFPRRQSHTSWRSIPVMASVTLPGDLRGWSSLYCSYPYWRPCCVQNTHWV